MFYTPRNKPALGLVVHGVTRLDPWGMGHPCAGHQAWSCKALRSSHGVLLGEQHRCEGSVPLGGAEALGSPLGIRAGVPWQPCKQGLPAGTETWTTLGCFISHQAQQVCLRGEFAYKPRMCKNKWPFPELFL